MGWRSSLIIIENPDNFTNDSVILKALGKSNYVLNSSTTLDECIYPNDKSINIGYYNGNIIISDDYQITTDSLERGDELHLTKEEQELVKIFPNSEIVTIACHSVVNYHAYSLIEKGVKKRIKTCTPEGIIQFGNRFEEENEIYSNSYEKDGQNYWKDENGDDDFTEDQLMEDFTFGIAKRRLGVVLDQSNGEELMESVPFKKYIGQNIFQFLKRKFFN